MRLVPVDIEIVSGRDIVPFDDDRAVETRGAGRTTHHHARLVLVVGVDDRAGRAVGRVIAIRRPLNEKFLFDVAATLQVLQRREKWILMRRITHGGGGGDRAGDAGVRGGGQKNGRGQRKQYISGHISQHGNYAIRNLEYTAMSGKRT